MTMDIYYRAKAVRSCRACELGGSIVASPASTAQCTACPVVGDDSGEVANG